MADIFISYSKADRLIVEQLAAYLEAEGWSVWWDRSLTAGDGFRDEIMRELAAARAVIVVWSQTSIVSDWVRAEAGRAKANSRLIPVKTAGVNYEAIPLPFGEMHTEPVENRLQVRAAVVEQLAKPEVKPQGLWMAWAETRYAAMTWIGIIGGAITLFANFRGVVQLADWAKLLVENWTTWTHAVWKWVFGWMKIEIARAYSQVISFSAFAVMTVVGSALAQRRSLSGRLPSVKIRSVIAICSILLIAPPLAYFFVPPMIAPILLVFERSLDPVISMSGILAIYYCCMIAMVWPFLLLTVRDRLATLILLPLYLPFPVLLAFAPILLDFDRNPDTALSTDEATLFAIALAIDFPIIALYILSAVILIRRFLLLQIGLVFLLGLNEIAKLELWRHLRV